MSFQAEPRVLVVVVLYRTAPLQSATVGGIVAALKSHREQLAGYDLLLWDNSPSPLDSSQLLDVPCHYQHSAINDGVAGAFNGAARLCTHLGYAWMLLLDQDTEVTADFLIRMLQKCRQIHGDERVSAIVPVLYDHDFQLSPQQVLPYRTRPVSPQPSRILDGEVFAANSGVAMRVASLISIGGYSLDFWLDHSDMYVFHQFYLRSMQVYLAADLRLQHNMTMLDYDRRMTPGRYDNFLHAEQAFIDLYKSRRENAVQTLRLLARVVKQTKYQNKTYSRMTLAFFLRRLVTSKDQRLKTFKSRTLQRQQPTLDAGA